MGRRMPPRKIPDTTANLAGSVATLVSADERIVSTRHVATLAVLFFLGVLSTAPTESSGQRYTGRNNFEKFDLDEAIWLFAKEKASEEQYIVDWVDPWFNNTHNRQRRVNRGYQVSVVMGDMVLGRPEPKPGTTKVQNLYETTFDGKTKQASNLEISETKDVIKTSSVETFKGFESNSTTTIEGGLPGILKVSAGWGIEVIIHRVKTDVTASKEYLSLVVNITVPPKKKVTVRWMVTTMETHIPWTVNVKLRGKFVVEYKGAYDTGRHERIYSITDLVPYFKDELRATGVEDEAEYTAQGMLKDLKAEKVEVRVKEEKLRRKKKS